MAKLVTDYLDKYSKAMVGHQRWAYLDCMTAREQLDVITTYKDQSLTAKYIVIVFEKNEQSFRHFERCEELGLNEED